MRLETGEAQQLVNPLLGWSTEPKRRSKGICTGLRAWSSSRSTKTPTSLKLHSMRAGGSSTVLMQYYMFLRLGREGYTRISLNSVI
jgi:hypothetical protein